MNRARGWIVIAAMVVAPSAGFAGGGDQTSSSAATLVRERTGVALPWTQDRSREGATLDTVRALLQGDLTESRAVQVALWNNRELRASFEGIGISQADFRQALLPINPIIEGEIRSGGGEGRPAELNVMQDLSSILLTPLRRRVAGATLRQASFEAADAALRLAAETRSAFYSYQAAERVRKVWEEKTAAAEAAADLARRQHEVGNITDLDIENEQALYEQAKIELARSQVEAMDVRERLNRAMGVWGEETRWRVSAELRAPPSVEVALDGLESTAVAQRLDLAAADAEVKSLAQAAPLARYLQFPELRAGVHIEREPDGTQTTGPALELALPLFDRGQATVARVYAQLRQAQERHASLAVAIRSEVRIARERLLAAQQLVGYYRNVVLPRRMRIAEQTQLEFNGMLVGVYQLLQAKQGEVNAQREHIEAQRDYWIARAELERAIGGPLTGVAQE